MSDYLQGFLLVFRRHRHWLWRFPTEEAGEGSSRSYERCVRSVKLGVGRGVDGVGRGVDGVGLTAQPIGSFWLG